MSNGSLEVQTHPMAIRLFHWLMALAIVILIGSSWRIYDSSPIFDFTFPEQFTLGGDVDSALALHNDPGVVSALAWHFAAMRLLALSYSGFMPWNQFSGHFWRDFLPVGPVSFWRDFSAAARFKLEHRLGEYNAVQRVAYWGRSTPSRRCCCRGSPSGNRCKPIRWKQPSVASRVPGSCISFP